MNLRQHRLAWGGIQICTHVRVDLDWSFALVQPHFSTGNVSVESQMKKKKRELHMMEVR